jgi:hypothetical protein
MMKAPLFAAAIVLLGGAAIVSPACANPIISVGVSESPGTPTFVTSSTSGIVAGIFATTNFVGTFSVVGSPILPQPTLATSTIDTATQTGGTLYVYITEQGLSSPQGANGFLSSFTANNFIGNVVSVQEYTFIDASNGLWGGTALGSKVFSMIGSDSSLTMSPSLGTPFSETALFVVQLNGPGSANNTIDIALPEPMSLGVLGSCLFGIVMVRRKRG